MDLTADSDDDEALPDPKAIPAESAPQSEKKFKIGTEWGEIIDKKPADVVVTSVGWKTLGVPYKYTFSELVETSGGLSDTLLSWGTPAQDIYVDCRALKDDNVKRLLMHTGFHVDIMEAVVKHRNFRNLVKQTKDLAKRCKEEGRATSIMAVCTSGAHRSVILAEALAFCFRKDGHEVVGPSHLSWCSWKDRKLCWTCERCKDEKKREQLHGIVYEMWKSA